MYRKFSLLNGNNVTLSLTDNTYCATPNGLGFSTDISTLRQGNESKLTYEQFGLSTIGLSVKISGTTKANVYANYRALADVLIYDPLYLIYELPNGTSYRRKCKVSSLTKGEIGTDGCLNCDLALTPLGFWEDLIETTRTITSFSSAQTFNIANTLDTPLYLSYYGGTLTNPSIAVTQNSVEYAYLKFLGTFGSMVVNANEVDESIVLTAGGVEEANPYSKQDFITYATKQGELKTFIKLKNGQSSMAFSGFSGGTFVVKYRNRYATV